MNPGDRHSQPPLDNGDDHLRNAVDATRFIGGIFTLTGIVAVLVLNRTSRAPAFAVPGVSTLIIAPGVLYVLAGVFLGRRRYWAWRATFVMTIVLLGAVLLLSAALVVLAVRTDAVEALGPLVALATWGVALGIILSSLRGCRCAVLEREQNLQKGFGVIPVARIAPPTPASPDGIAKTFAEANPTSYSLQSDLSPPRTPPRR